MEHRVACFAKNFANLQFCAELSNVSLSLFCKNVRFAFFIPQKILERPSFPMSRKFKMQGFQWNGVTRIKSIFTDEGKRGTRFGAPLYYNK